MSTDGEMFYQLIARLAPDPIQVSKWVEMLRKENPELSSRELAEFVGESIIWEYPRQGAALTLPGAIPGLGTILQVTTEVAAISADIALMVRNQAYLVFAIACCSDNRCAREELVKDTLICIGLWTRALAMTKSGFIRVGTKAVEVNFKRHFPAAILRTINRQGGDNGFDQVWDKTRRRRRWSFNPVRCRRFGGRRVQLSHHASFQAPCDNLYMHQKRCEIEIKFVTSSALVSAIGMVKRVVLIAVPFITSG